ncbi:MAG: iron ABC transporter substrate-binding protein [Chloroflexi bacterium]|nr:iron ABC transporter substrate-binding protein [Chloroflexota bacterium]
MVIYSGRSETLVQPIIDQFAAATGIEVEVRYGSTSEIAATILEEGQNSPADLFYAQDPGGLGAVQAAGLLAPLSSDILSQVPARFADVNGEWVGVSGRARVVVYNTDVLTEADLPEGIEGFTDAKWAGKIGWAPSNGSFQAMVTAMRNIWGEERTRAWLTGIQANNPVVFENNTAVVAAAGTGEIEVGFVNHYYLFRFLAEQGDSFPVRNHFIANGGPESLLMVSGAGILKTAANAVNAERFISFLLSVPGQQYFTSQTYEYPLVEGVAVSPLLTPLAEVDAAAADIALNDLSDLEGTAALLSELGILP